MFFFSTDRCSSLYFPHGFQRGRCGPEESRRLARCCRPAAVVASSSRRPRRWCCAPPARAVTWLPPVLLLVIVAASCRPRRRCRSRPASARAVTCLQPVLPRAAPPASASACLMPATTPVISRLSTNSFRRREAVTVTRDKRKSCLDLRPMDPDSQLISIFIVAMDKREVNLALARGCHAPYAVAAVVTACCSASLCCRVARHLQETTRASRPHLAPLVESRDCCASPDRHTISISMFLVLVLEPQSRVEMWVSISCSLSLNHTQEEINGGTDRRSHPRKLVE